MVAKTLYVVALVVTALCGQSIVALGATPAAATPLTGGAAPPATPPADKLGRQNPRSSATGFLEACQSGDYQKASQYLDLREFSSGYRAENGPKLAKKLEAILNSDPRFSVLRLSRNPEGDLSSPNPNREPAATITQNGQALTLELERVTLQDRGQQVWLFSQDTVSALPKIEVSAVAPAMQRYLPPFLVSQEILQTPLWKWLALILIALLMISLSRLLDWLLVLLMRLPEQRIKRRWKAPWLEALIRPMRVILWLAVLRIGIGVVDPSAIARLYIGRGMELVFVWSVAWCVIRLVDLLMNRLEQGLDTPQKLASRTLLRLGRRTANLIILVFAILAILQNWGYNTSTLIAGLGVGGIAVALAAQQTIANVFGGVSLIGDHPVRIGEFGKFGDMIGVVEDIGMRSTRIRTLNRTIVSVPNSNFAGLNLENYSIRDKILFNPTFQIKRSASDEQVRALIDGLTKMISNRRDLEPVPTPARLVGLASGSFAIEVFCYVLTPDVDQFYKVQSELLLSINDIFKASNIELAS
jgi:MscS family membrane protein